MTKKKFWGWTDKQWAASIMASLYGGPGMVLLAVTDSYGMGIMGIAVGIFLWWALSTAGEGRKS